MNYDKLITHTHPSSERFKQLQQEVLEMHHKKAKDYGTHEDPLANIRNGGEFINVEPWRAAFVRIADKCQRLQAFCKNGKLENETMRDTLLDLSSYALLALVLFEESEDDRSKHSRRSCAAATTSCNIKTRL